MSDELPKGVAVVLDHPTGSKVFLAEDFFLQFNEIFRMKPLRNSDVTAWTHETEGDLPVAGLSDRRSARIERGTILFKLFYPIKDVDQIHSHAGARLPVSFVGFQSAFVGQ